MSENKYLIYAGARFKPRSGTAAEWAEANPILDAGEPGVVINGTETEKIKFGDGTTPWDKLGWWRGPRGEQGSRGEDGVAPTITVKDYKDATRTGQRFEITYPDGKTEVFIIYDGQQGPKGDKGDSIVGPAGPQGETGPQGPQGPQGPKGDSANVDQTYNPNSENAQSGKAVAEAIANAGGGGGNIDVDQTYSPTSKNAQSGKAVEQAIAGINSLGDVAMHGNIAMQGGKITQLSEPTDSADAVNKRYADNLISANDAMVFKGTLGAGGTITSVPTPSVGYNVGWTYKIITAGTYVGQKCEVGDMLISVADASSYSGNPYNIVNEHWVVVQSNIDAQTLINDALAQAKASGEFDGKDGTNGKDGANGKDGTSVTVKSVSESAADGGSNVVTFSDGKTLTIKNGSKGSQGIQGIQGVQGPKGDKGDTGATGSAGANGKDGKDGVSATHSWNGTTLTITSASGTSSANLKGEKGDKGDKGDTGLQGVSGVYVGSGEMPDGYNVQIDPNGEATKIATSWDDIEDKPFGYFPTGGDTVSWDGNIEGRASVQDMLFKVSDAVPKISDFANGFSISIGSEISNGTMDCPAEWAQRDDDGIIILGEPEGFLPYGFILDENVADQHGVIPGTYLLCFDMASFGGSGKMVCSSLTIPQYDEFQYDKKIEKRFLPPIEIDDVPVETFTIGLNNRYIFKDPNMTVKATKSDFLRPRTFALCRVDEEGQMNRWTTNTVVDTSNDYAIVGIGNETFYTAEYTE